MSIVPSFPLRALCATVMLVGCASVPRIPDAAGAPSSRNVGVVLQPRTLASDVTLRQIEGVALSRDPMRPLMDVLASYWPNVGRLDPRRPPQQLQRTTDDVIGVYTSGGNFLGGLDMLRTMRSGEVLRVQRLTQVESYQRFGRTHANGSIVVTRWRNER